MKYLLNILIALFVCSNIHAQISDQEVHDVAVEDRRSPEEIFRSSIPARLKTGKPQFYRYNNLCGYILNDSVLIPCKYESLDTKYSDVMVGRAPRGLYGAINKKGETVFPFEYVSLNRIIGPYLSGWKQHAGYGLMDTARNVLVPTVYQKGFWRPADSIMVYYSPGKQLALKILPDNSLRPVLETAFEAVNFERTGNYPFFGVQQNGRWGLMDFNQKLLTACAYDGFEWANNRYAIATQKDRQGIIALGDTAMRVCTHPYIRPQLRNGCFPVGHKAENGKKLWGLVQANGKMILPEEYDHVEEMYQTELVKVQKNGLYGLADTLGRVLYSPKYTDISPWKHSTKEHGKFRDDQYGKYFIFKKQGSDVIGLLHIEKGEILPAQFDYFRIDESEQLIIASKGDLQALYDVNGRCIVDVKYRALIIHPGYIAASLGDKRTLLRRDNGRMIQEEWYDDCFTHNAEALSGYFFTKKDNLIALHAPDGRRLTPHHFKSGMRPCSELPELAGKLPAGRKWVACTFQFVNEKLVPVAIDDTGAEYPYQQ